MEEVIKEEVEESVLERIETDIGTFTENKILGLSAQEVYEKELKRREQIDICTPPTDKERIIKLEEEKSILAENVYQLAGIIEAMLGDGNNG